MLLRDDTHMATPMTGNSVPPEVLADLQAVTDALTNGQPVDPEVARRIRDRAEKARRELLATRGVQEIGAQIIREIRGDVTEP
jgi:hypothetical protein